MLRCIRNVNIIIIIIVCLCVTRKVRSVDMLHNPVNGITDINYAITLTSGVH